MNRKSFIIVLWISFFIGTVTFIFFTGDKTVSVYFINLFIAVLYALTISAGNGMINVYLSRHYSWVEETRTRAILGIVATVLVNVVLILFCNYTNLVLFQKMEFTGFFSGTMGFVN